MKTWYGIILVFLLIQIDLSLAQSLIRLKAGTIDVSQLPVQADQSAISGSANSELVLVVCSGKLQAEWVGQLRSAGLMVISYIPENTLLVRGDETARGQASSCSFVEWIGSYKAKYKCNESLAGSRTSASWQAFNPVVGDRDAKGRMSFDGIPPDQINVMTPLAADVLAVRSFIENGGGSVSGVSTGGTKGFLRAEVSSALHTELAARSDVEWIEDYYPPKLANNVAVTGRLMNVRRVWNELGLTGAGQVVGHADTGLDSGDVATLMPDFFGRVIAGFGIGRTNDWSDPMGHGTHTAGSIIGNGASSDGLFKGTAYEAELVHQSLLTGEKGITLPVDLNDLFMPCYELGARIHSDSWGDSTRGYLLETYQIDEFVWNHPTFLPVFSAGNDGADLNRDGRVDMGQIGFIAEAKNTLVVGAAETWRSEQSNGDQDGYQMTTCPMRPIGDDSAAWPYDGTHPGMAAFSSRGPCVDGRIKPDIVAPGTAIISCRTSQAPPPSASDVRGDVSTMALASNYVFMMGTSMSCPLTAGAAALVRQFYVEQGGWTNPSAALIKATLMGGADSLYPGQYGSAYSASIPEQRPNSIEGWGALNLVQALCVSNGMPWSFYDVDQTNGLSTGEEDTYSVVVSNSCMLSVTLAWSDYPAQPEASRSLVNDLDLVLTAPDGQRYYPNRMSGPDRLNTVETIDVSNAGTGRWTICVSGYNVPSGAILGKEQGYAVVVHGRPVSEPETVLLSAGVSPSVVVPGIVPLIRAHVQGDAAAIDQISLRYRLNGGSWLEQAMSSQVAGVYEGELVAFDAGDRIEYQVRLLTAGGQQLESLVGFFHCRPRAYEVRADQTDVPADEYMLTNNAFGDAFPLELAVNYAPPGSELIVHDGDYMTCMGVWVGNPLHIYGLSYPPKAILSGTIFGPALVVEEDATIERLEIKGGMNIKSGGCVVLQQGTLRQCLVGGGLANKNGGGIYAANDARVESCIIRGCYAKKAGGGVYVVDQAFVDHCLVISNMSAEAGGVLASDEAHLQHLTAAFNVTTNSGALDLQDSVLLCDSIVYENTPVLGGTNSFDPGVAVSNCCIERLTPSQMVVYCSFTNDPQLNADGHLCASSPYKDRVAASVVVDVDGEYAWDDPTVTNHVGIADLGGDEWVDYDLDTQADYWEIIYFDSLQTTATDDGDGDGLDNEREYLFITSPLNADTDGDDYDDGDEVFAGTNPLDTNSFLGISFADFNGELATVNIVWPSVAGRRYGVFFSSNLTSTGWVPLATNLPAFPPQNVYTTALQQAFGVFLIRVDSFE